LIVDYGYANDETSAASLSSNWTMIVCIGALIGSYLVGDIANNFGRRKSMIVFDIIMMLGCGIMNINIYAT